MIVIKNNEKGEIEIATQNTNLAEASAMLIVAYRRTAEVWLLNHFRVLGPKHACDICKFTEEMIGKIDDVISKTTDNQIKKMIEN